jgi:hypothetical protein
VYTLSVEELNNQHLNDDTLLQVELLLSDAFHPRAFTSILECDFQHPARSMKIYTIRLKGLIENQTMLTSSSFVSTTLKRS